MNDDRSEASMVNKKHSICPICMHYVDPEIAGKKCFSQLSSVEVLNMGWMYADVWVIREVMNSGGYDLISHGHWIRKPILHMIQEYGCVSTEALTELSFAEYVAAIVKGATT